MEQKRTIRILEDRCPHSHACPAVRICPAKALSQEGMNPPVVDPALCTGCGLCTRKCPKGALQLTDQTSL